MIVLSKDFGYVLNLLERFGLNCSFLIKSISLCVERDIFQFIMNGFFLLKRPFIWLGRFRHRCGYGVHSPFAFDLITNVIYERTPYYAYSSLEAEQKKMSANSGRKWKHESKKVNRLLFRLVNYIQPDTIVDAGTLSASFLYLVYRTC